MRLLDILLLPISFLYAMVMRFRNWLYDRDIRKSFSFDTCVVSVGNLSVGGAGKTPMTEYLIRLLRDSYQVSTLSRGYGRKTRGFRLAKDGDSARTLGDEPYQYFRKFESIRVAVGEERAVAIPFILAEAPETQIILLDDAFQHRAVQPDLQILVTEYTRVFTRDHVMPAGRLREPRKGAGRADVIVVSKCPDTLEPAEEARIRREINEYAPEKPVYFTAVQYEQPVAASPTATSPTDALPTPAASAGIILVTGIANPAPLAGHLQDLFTVREHLVFPDHHAFSEGDVRRITDRLQHTGASLFTTEKDLMRMMHPAVWDKLRHYPVWYVPIRVRFLHDEEKFNDQVLKVVEATCS